ncbi:mitochondrial cytochrome b2-like protein [Delitschia confertaspora ATCC 74209]|uniref:L-lactate dehydrogenase (cytochrome) n=1 Tax=Delitschia confertaspora ATCC 74209 TaxID=1513339 RepID=A0A9P4JIE3_9PLEO|nr:mitochondrial cytochrome b2-like protein [Delitschia confertaspora ATCC 74209]
MSEKKEKLVSASTVRQHCTAEDCWVVVDGKVWDISSFLPEHPGGAEVILTHAGCDATSTYNSIHAPALLFNTLGPSKLIGHIDTTTISSIPADEWIKPPPSKSAELLLSEKPPLETLISSHDFETVASKTLSAKAWAFYSSAATDCVTHRANKEYFDRIWFRPRVLRNMAGPVNMRTTILEERKCRGKQEDVDMPDVSMSAPFFCAPAAMARLVHDSGEMGIAKGCAEKGVVQCISTNASFPASEICGTVSPDHPFLFQLYVNKDRSATSKLLKSFPKSIKAILVTVDAATPGKREADERVRSDESLMTPMSGARAVNDKKGGALGRIMGNYIDPGLNWEDLKWLRKETRLPIVVKGVMSVEDAVMCAETGVEGVVISNHGGRNLDTSPPSLRVLLQLHLTRPDVFGKLDVYLDGGIRRGTDVLKALCLGAKAVGIGRPFLYNLNYGSEGVAHLIDILKDELEVAMKLIGITDLSQAGPQYLDLGESIRGLISLTSENPPDRRTREGKIGVKHRFREKRSEKNGRSN